MKIGILTHGVELSAALRDYAQRRLTTAVSRYRHVVDAVAVRLVDLNGPKGGIDKACVVHAQSAAFPAVLVRERDADLYAAIDRASGRLDRALARRLGRRRDLERGRRS
jgi:ribosomal subunit interface protein